MAEQSLNNGLSLHLLNMLSFFFSLVKHQFLSANKSTSPVSHDPKYIAFQLKMLAASAKPSTVSIYATLTTVNIFNKLD